MTNIKAVDVSEIEKLQIYYMYNQDRELGSDEAVRAYIKLSDIRALLDRSPSVREQANDYTPNKDCSMCNGSGQYCVGYSGSESDGNAPILERCEC